jgi:general secretion pathway protein M
VAWQDRELQRLDRHISALEDRMVVRERMLAERHVLEDAVEGDGTVLSSASPSLAAASLQGLLTQLVRFDSGNVGSAQVLEPRESEGFTEVGVRLQVRVTMKALRHILYTIETGTPVMLIRALAVDAGEPGTEPEDADPQVSATLDVVGFMRDAQPSAAAANSTSDH